MKSNSKHFPIVGRSNEIDLNKYLVHVHGRDVIDYEKLRASEPALYQKILKSELDSNQRPLQVEYSLIKPDPERDASFALGWFTSPHGKETLLKMGNAESSIKESTLEGEKETLREFLELEQQGKQLTWMIRVNDKTIGAVWIELEPTEYLAAPAVHVMIGDIDYRGYGIGTAVLQEMIAYARDALRVQTLYSRYLQSNHAIAKVLGSLGFTKDSDSYQDAEGLEWQNVNIDL